MIQLNILSSRNYESNETNYGDCILIDTCSELVIYDCGSKEHAMRVEQYMSEKGYEKAILVLSHNDADHFDGIPYLLENKLISTVYAQLFLKHKSEIIKILNDGRVTNKSLSNKIKDDYDNISSLSKLVELRDAIDLPDITQDISIVGPDKDYTFKAIAKELKNSEGNTLNSETVINAASVQLSVNVNGKKVLLCGDSSFEALGDKIYEFDVIQLPHHGKADTAEKIFETRKEDTLNVLYLVSDNTGTTNGGSSKLKSVGKRVENTLNGDITYPSYNVSVPITRTLGLF